MNLKTYSDPKKIDEPPPVPYSAARVRAILYTDTAVLMIKRVRAGHPAYWVAPGGGIEPHDANPRAALARELHEELGATAFIDYLAFVYRHHTMWQLFFVCHLQSLNLTQRHGPETQPDKRGLYLPELLPLHRTAITQTPIQPLELQSYLWERCL